MKYALIISVLCTLFVGCGGGGSGGGGDDTDATPNNAPVAIAGPNQTIDLGQTTTLSGNASSDADGDSLTYSWSITSSPNSSSPSIAPRNGVETSFSTDTAGGYDIELTVSDGTKSSSDIVTVTVVDSANTTLVAHAGSGYSAAEGVDIVLDGSSSVAPEGQSLSYRWEIISGPSMSTTILTNGDSVKPTLESTSVGSYEVELVITSDDGSIATDIAEVLVLDYFPISNSVEHYTQISPADDTRIIYVSSQDGDDGNDGLSSLTPVQSISRGISLLRDGQPDWLALKSGDTWETGFGKWVKSGRSESEPMVITSYGAGSDRPLIRTKNETGLYFQGGGGAPEYVDYLVIHGLHFYAASRDPNSADFTDPSSDKGISWLRSTRGILIEDNMFQFYQTGIVIQGGEGVDIQNVLIKNNVIVDSYHTTAHAQGIYLSSTENARVERNVFDHAGWNSDIEGGEKTIFNHSIYVQTSNRNVEIVDNIITRSSSHGVQLRPGGLIQGNVLVSNPISLMLGSDSVQPGVINSNTILHGNDILESLPRGGGIDIVPEVFSAEITNNIIAHEDSIASNPIAISESSVTTESGNAVFNWGDQSQDAAKYPNPTVTILDFDAQAGGDGTMESFFENIRSHSSRNPNPSYDVENIRSYFQEAFGIKE